MKIDLVYLWFNPNDKDWRAQKIFWQKQIGIVPEVNEKFSWIENDELKYALRSAEKFAPWVNHIYIVTGFGQIPKWLNAKHPKITIVPHEKILPADALPTFNSNAIEMCVGNIPGLSEHFLLACDDMFFGADVSPDYFFNEKGFPIIRHARNHFFGGNYKQEMGRMDLWRQHHLTLFQLLHKTFGKKLHKYMPSHNIDPYLKSTIAEVKHHHAMRDGINKTIRNKFRTPGDIPRWVYTMYDFIHNRCEMHRIRTPKSSKHFIYNTWFGLTGAFKTSPQYHETVDSLGKKMPILFCINKSDKNNFAKIFPNKSRYEK